MPASAQPVVPSSGYSGVAPQPAVSGGKANAPTLVHISEASLSNLFRVVPTYPRASSAGLKVVGSYTVKEPSGARLVGAWSPGYLPITLSFSDGHCYSFEADYYGTLKNGRLNPSSCKYRHIAPPPQPSPPASESLRLIGSAWGYGAWIREHGQETIITAPNAKTFEPLFTARMTVSAIMAMNGPDGPGGNVTLVGKIHGKLTVVTLEVGY
ncbi:hypothetical protein [Novosphingobium sp. BL-8A]|uniref:hypothetical protein n=1 Tax=Novosphingobium sp. BL-8A TaxID=3127639 RepID=UPI0037568E8B